ncbi:helix-turn-helix transcriptional regulator [Jatrophihabitans sp. DSM 45814]
MTRLRGRKLECATLDQLLDAARSERSGVLVLRGEAGVGKTALLAYAAEQSNGWRILHAVGVQSEMELPFAGLQLLCAPLLAGRQQLPVPQRDALGTAFGLSSGPRPDRFLVGLAVLSLLSGAAENQPLLCLVDDAQWLDRSSAQVLSFVARRLQMESIVLLLAEREQDDVDELTGLPDLRLGGLSYIYARDLLASTITGPLDERVRDRIIAETRGNPLALLELPRGLTAADLAGGFNVPGGPPLPSRIEASFRRQVGRMPTETQQLLLLAAAEPVGDPALLRLAAERLAIPIEAASPAEADGLLEVGARVTLRHPLLRSAIYGAASSAERRSVHRALSEVTDAQRDPDRRAWHRAQASPGPNEEVAAELERSAGRAQTRGGLAATAAFLERAARLTPESGRQAQRALAAAHATYEAGAHEAALALLATAQAGPLDETARARVGLLHAQIAFGSRRGGNAPALLLAAATQLEPFDSALARDTHLHALSAALFVGRFAGEIDVLTIARAAHAATPSPARPPDLLLDGLTLVITDGYAAGAPLLKRAVNAFRTGKLPTDEAIRWLWFATHAAHDLWDDESWELLCTRHVRLARQAGALAVLPLALSARIGLHLFAGELASASSLVEEVAAVTDATGSLLPPYGAIALAAWQGDESTASRLIETAIDEVASRGEGMGLTLIQHAKALLCNALGQFQEALVAAEEGAAYASELAFYNWSLVELVEAASRSGQPARAAHALQQLVQTTGPSGTDWALGSEARSRALLSTGDTAEGFYREAIHYLSRTRVRTELARAHLVYGEWLRRESRRTDAREQLRTAHQMFTAMGTNAFAARAARELRATGEIARKRSVETTADLTAQESQIALCARDGMSNPEIGAHLFLSPRTVEWHLTNVFAKLGIASRRELRGVRTNFGPDAAST